MSSETAIEVHGLGKCYQLYDQPRDRLKQFVLPRIRRWTGKPGKNYFREFWALKGVSFEVRKGETVGIIGRNGSGKSTLLQLICGTLNPTTGLVRTSGRIAALLELGSGFNPEFTGRENVYLNAAVLGLSNEEIESRLDDIRGFADIDEFIDQPVKTYSSGMVVRLAFAVAINVRPEILVIDEALAVGDAAFQRKCMRRIEELSQAGVTLLFVSHDTETVRKLCGTAVYLHLGEVRYSGTAKETCTEYERDLFGASKGRDAQADVHPQTAADRPLIDPDLLTTNEKIYGDGRAKIVDVRVTNQLNARTNVLFAGDSFVVSYQVRFTQRVSKPVFGIMIGNREGVCVFGTNTAGRDVSLREYTIGDFVSVAFRLTNNLGPGVYYLTCGVHSSDNPAGLVYLQRRMDTLLIKSVTSGDAVIAGTAHLYPEVDAQSLKCESNPT